MPESGALLGMRPEHLLPLASGQRPDGVVLELQVAAVEAVGAETFVYGQLPAGKEIVVRISETAPDIGSHIVVGLPRERLHLFDLDRGRRL